MSFVALQEEACEVFTVGIDLFFLSTLEQAQFLLELLDSAGQHSGNIPPKSLRLKIVIRKENVA